MAQAPSVAIPTRLPLVIEPANRDDVTSYDSKLVNSYMETHRQGDTVEVWVYKRAGLAVDATHSAAAPAVGLGLYHWVDDIYSIFGTSLYKNGVFLATVDATTGPGAGLYYFTTTLGSVPKLVFGNGVKAYYYDGTSVVEITAIVTPFKKGWAYLDGTIYSLLISAHVQGSGINDPATWDPLNSIMAQIEPDRGIAIAKQLVYAIVFKEWTTEIFYDAGNATGSPLAPVQGAKVGYGCAHPESIQSVDDELFWLATTKAASLEVAHMAGLKVAIISTKAVERLLDMVDITTVYSWHFKEEGHLFYGLTIVNANLTLVYDKEERSWAQWTDSAGNYFPIVAVTFDNTRQYLFQHESNGVVYTIDRGNTTDAGATITVDIVTPNFDGGTRRIKHLNMIEFIGDQTTDCTLQVRYNDKDYNPANWSAYRTVNMANTKPMLVNNGSFRRRAYHIRHQAATRLRIQAVDMQLDIGTL